MDTRRRPDIRITPQGGIEMATAKPLEKTMGEVCNPVKMTYYCFLDTEQGISKYTIMYALYTATFDIEHGFCYSDYSDAEKLKCQLYQEAGVYYELRNTIWMRLRRS
jgi:hypothetical protein